MLVYDLCAIIGSSGDSSEVAATNTGIAATNTGIAAAVAAAINSTPTSTIVVAISLCRRALEYPHGSCGDDTQLFVDLVNTLSVRDNWCIAIGG